MLADDGASFPIGSTVTVRLAGTAASDLSRVPIGALHDPGDGAGVWRVGADLRVRFAPVRVVELAQEHALVASGVAVGDSVVALGAHLLHEGGPRAPVGDAAGGIARSLTVAGGVSPSSRSGTAPSRYS